MKSRRVKQATVAHMAAQKQATETVRKMLKLTIVTLHDEFGFGSDRLAKFTDAFNRVCAEAETDEVFWAHVDKICDDLNVVMQKEEI